MILYFIKSLKLLFIVLNLISFLEGQSDFFFNNISVKDGLSESTVKVVFEDKTGFIYFGTENGLDIYDGYEFKNYHMNSFDSSSIFGNKVSSIYQDRKKNIWLGTELGISVFDPNTRRFSRPIDPKENNTQPINNPETILEDESGNMWIKLSENGFVYKYNPLLQETRCLNCSDSSIFGSRKVSVLYSDHKGSVWIGTDDGLFINDVPSEEIVKFSLSNELDRSRINIIKEGKRGELWVGTDDGLVKIALGVDREIKIFKKSVNENSIISNYIKDIDWDDTKNELWIATNKGLSRLVVQNGKFYNIQTTPYADGIIENDITEILYAGKSKRLWFTTENHAGINCLSVIPNIMTGDLDTVFTHFEHDPIDQRSIADNNVTDFIEDKAGNIWITTAQNGVSFNSLIKPKFTSFRYDSENEWGLKSNKIYSIAVQDDGMLWVATGFGLELLSSDGIREYEYNKSLLAINYIIDLEIIDDHILWVATDLGVLKINTMTDQIIRFAHSGDIPKQKKLSNDLVHDILLVDGKIWAATDSGISIIDTISNSVNNLNKNLKPRLIVRDHDGDIWLGSESKGLSRIEKKYIKNFEQKKNVDLESHLFDSMNMDGLSSSQITCVAQDQKGSIWVGTNGGLNKYSKIDGTFLHYFIRDGLPSNYITGIVIDENDNLWISSKKGISFFDHLKETFTNYGLNDGIGNIDFHRNSYDVSSDGDIYFGGPLGISKFTPKNIQYNQYKPPCRITRIKKAYFDDTIEEVFSQINTPHATAGLIIGHRVKSFTIDFVSLNYHKAEKNKYRYKLIPFDRDWVESGGLRFASYNNLGRNTYEFIVQGSNDDGLWSDPEKLMVKFVPHPLLSYLAIAIYSIISIIVIFVYVRHRMVKQKYQLEEERRIKELEEAREFQMSLIPQAPPDHPDYDIALHMKTSTEVGGDYYDFFPQEDGSMYVVCGDATGHGLNAGMMVSITKAGLYGSNFDTPDNTTTRLNKTIKAIDLGTTRMSLNMAKFHNGSFDFTSAGMPPAYLYKSKEKTVDEILVPGLPLGSMKKADFDLHKFNLNRNDVLVLISDGLPECVNHDGEMLDYQAVKDCIMENGSKSAQGIVDSLIDLGDRWMSGLMNDDDITLVVIKKK